MSGRSGSEGSEKTALAEDRTEYAADRTALANERTCSAWIRTGLAGVLAGFGVVRFLGDTLPAWAIKPIATICMVCAIAAFVISAWRYHGLRARLHEAEVGTVPFWLILGIDGLLIMAALIGLASIWLVRG